MNSINTTTTPTPQALLIKNWNQYFENGQTRRIKNLAYSLMQVDHDPLTRKLLLRKGAEGYRALAVFAELVGIAARCPQRGLLADSKGPVMPDRIAAMTGLALGEVEAGLELLASKDVAWITHVACPQRLIVSGSLRTGRKGKPLQPELVHLDDTSSDSPDLHIEWEYAIIDKGHGPETERRLPSALKRLLDAQKEGSRVNETVACHTPSRASKMPDNVARHIVKPKPNAAPTVACHTEGVDIQKQPIQTTEADRRAVDRFVNDLEKSGLLGSATVRVKKKTMH